MPPSTLQARIKAFEALGSGASKEVLDGVAIHTEPEHLLDRPHSPSAASIPPIVPTTYSPSASPNSLRNRNSLLDLKDWVIDDGPLGASPNTAILSGYSPLPVTTPLPHESAPLISFDGSPPKFAGAPPLPPRKLSFNSPRSVSAPAASPAATTTSPSNNMLMPPATDGLTLADLPSDGLRRGHMHASSVSSFHSVSLSSDGDDLATPGALHAFPMEREWTGTTEDGESLDESFENVSAPSSFLPPSTFPPRQPPLSPGKPALTLPAKQPPPPPPSSQPPKLPHRPVPYSRSSTISYAPNSSSPSPVNSGIGSPVTRTSSASSSSLSLQNTRRLPPPPPPVAATAAIAIPPSNAPRPRSHPPSARTSVQSTATTASDRSSLLSHGTTTSRTSISSRTSVSTPTSAPGAKQQAQATRARYDALFIANVRAHAPKPPPPTTPTPAKRQNAGWRGLSIDVPPPIPASPAPAPPPPPPPGPADPGPEARLDGRIVRVIWLKSRLEPQRLRGLWNECDPDGTGSLDRDAFARGMGRIDEELRRAQVLGRARAGSSASARPVPSRPILR